MALRTRLLHALILGLLGAAAALATIQAVRSELAAGAGCGPVDPLDGALTAALGAGAFGLGHLAARRRASAAWARTRRRTTVAVRLVVAAVLLLATAVLVYETLAILRVGGLHTITAFVRCARGQAPGITAAAAATACFLAGHWLWYPPERAR